MKLKSIEIPKMRDHSPKFDELERKRDAINAMVATKEAERLALGMMDPATEDPAEDPAMRRAAEILGETPQPAKPTRKEQLIRLAGEIRDLKAASNLLTGQMRVERTKASAIVRGLVAPEYGRLARSVCEALIALHRANVEFQSVRTALEDADIEWTSLGVMSNYATGDARDPYSPIGIDLHDAARLGFIRKDQIPAEIRQ